MAVTEHSPQEAARLAAVRRFEILDTPPDGAFDRITSLAARLLRVPIAIASIVDEDRIWFKSHHGLDVREVGRDPGLCASAILLDTPTVLEDASRDPVALTNPLVASEFGLRFYAAAPLVTSDGHKLGTLCVIDREPRTITSDELGILVDLAALVMSELEIRLAARSAVALEVELRADSERLRDDAARLASALQTALLPPQLPTIGGVEVASCFRPADPAGVGGDFYDVFALSRRAWGIVVGDVCGKGPDAAMVTTAARFAARAAAVEHESPSAVLRAVNDALLLGDQDQPERFCTLLYARLRPHGSEFQLSMACGGHPLAQILRADGRVESFGTPGTIVGSFPDPHFVDVTTRLRRGDAVVLFTDGLTESTRASHELGADGVAHLLRTGLGVTAKDLVADLAEEASKGEARRRDDLVVVCLRVTGQPQGMTDHTMLAAPERLAAVDHRTSTSEGALASVDPRATTAFG